MKKIYLFAAFWGFALLLSAQQEDQFTQFMYYKMGFNPAYAGSQDGTCISGIVRQQWIGLEGAPQTQLVTFNMPLFNRKVGIGANVLRHTIGLSERYAADAVYAYRFRVGRGWLGVGVQASVRFLRTNFNQAVATQPKEVDGAIPQDIQSKYVPNFGAGIYYNSRRFYLGFSAPRLLENNIDLADSETIISREVRHFYAMGGLLFDLGEKVQLQPQVLLKYVKGAPFDGDANLNLIINNRFTTGLSYRLGGSKRSGIGESVALIVGAQISDGIFFGLSYDYTLSELRAYNNGSVEGVLRFCFGGRSDDSGDYVSPRFF